MAFDITEKALAASLGTDLRPQIVLEIDGIDTIFSTTPIEKIIRYGDPDLEYGEGDVYGGLRAIDPQESVISFQRGTSTTISQTLNLDKGLGESISSMRIALVDKDQRITRDILSPDTTQTPAFDVLGRRCRIWFGFEGTSFKEDFITIFRGVIQNTSAGAGVITLNINHPDQKKKSDIFIPASAELTSAMGAGDTVANVDDTLPFFAPVLGPDGLVDESVKFFVRIDDEIMRYEAKSGTQFQTITRGQLGTLAAAHSSGASVESFITLSGNAIDLALKLMLSGWNGPFLEDQEVESFVGVGAGDTVPNAIFFANTDVARDFGAVVGDYVTVTGASNGSNNVTLEPIVGITTNTLGSYIEIDPAVPLVLENDSSAVCDFRSQYDTLGDGAKMMGDEVDIDEHLFIQRTFLSSFEYEFYIREEIKLKEFLSEQIYNPAAAYSLPRKSKSSVGYHLAGQLPGTKTKLLSERTVTNPSQLKLERSLSKNFYNSVTYKFEEDALEEKLLRVDADIDADSLARIEGGIRNKLIEAKGMRLLLSAINNANIARSRILKKFRFGAEFIKGLKSNLKTGFDIEVGDTAVLDLNTLNISDIDSGTRNGDARIFQLSNKSFNLKTGDITFDIVDTNFDRDTRFALIGPCSKIKTGISTTQFVIEETGNSPFGVNEFRKWEDFEGTGVKIRSLDFTVEDEVNILNVIGNTITVSPALSFVPLNGYFMEPANYNLAIDEFKLLYGHMTDNANFDDGEPVYSML
jgi:hypothetical protein